MNHTTSQSLICSECLTIDALRCFNEENFESGVCGLCGCESIKVTNLISNERFIRYANVLIGNSCDNFDFCGLDWVNNLREILRSKGWIINASRSISRISLDDAISKVFFFDGFGNRNYYESPEGIIREFKEQQYSFIKNRIQNQLFGFHGLMIDIEELCDVMVPHILVYEPPDLLFRARRGSHREKNEDGTDSKYLPLKDKDLLAPPINSNSFGRINRNGVSVLYLSENERTVIHEIRPNPGDMVSVAQFKVNRKLKIANLVDLDYFGLSATEELVGILNGISSLSKIFSEPVGSKGDHRYLPTQLFSERLIRNNFDGICYKSAFTKDRNVALFDTESASIIPDSARLIYIKSVEANYDRI